VQKTAYGKNNLTALIHRLGTTDAMAPSGKAARPLPLGAIATATPSERTL
jgi:hypothetical protein